MFERRSTRMEWMDDPDFDKTLAERSFRFIEKVNRFLGGTRIVKQFIANESTRMSQRKTLKVLDMGSGSCDIPLAVCRWAQRKRIPVHFTCVEMNEHAAEIAHRNLTPLAGLPVTILNENIFHHRPAEPYDCAIGSMFFHHLDEGQILHLIGHLSDFVKGSLLINDLLRCFPSYVGCVLLTLGFPRDVRHDALLSIRRGFREAELKALLASLEGVSVDVGTAPFFRVKAVIRFQAKDKNP